MYKVIALAILSLLIVIGGYVIYDNKSISPQELQSKLTKAYLMQHEGVMGKNLIKANLINNEGQPFSTKQLKGEWSLLFFGFTYCPDICITELNLLSKIYQALAAKGGQKLPQVYLVSVDPKRDTPAKLNSYVKHFNPNFKALTGEKNELHQFMKPFGAYYEFSYYHDGKNESVKSWEQIPKSYQDSYTINHTAWIYLINPVGKLIASFPTPHDGETMLNDIQLILDSLDQT